MDEPKHRCRLSRAEVLAALAVLTIAGLVVQDLASQQASRMALTASIAEHGTIRIDRFEGGALRLDFASKDGHLYSDKAPAQPILAVPFYLGYKAVGGESAEVLRPQFNLGLWWVSLWSSALPAAALVIVMARLARPWSTHWSLPAALAMSFGSLLLPFGTLLFSHTASALCVAGSLIWWRRAPATPASLAIAGLLAGTAVSLEYTTIVALGVLGIATVARDRAATTWLVMGAAGPLTATAAYHWIAFGSPLAVPYRYHNLGLHDSAVAGLTLPSPARMWELMVSGRGVFFLTPIVFAAVIGLGFAARDRASRRPEVAVVAATLLVLMVLQAGAADLTGGDSLGPRYVIPALPGLVIGVASLWTRRPFLCAGVAAISTAMMVFGTFTDPLLSVTTEGVLRTWFEVLRNGNLARTLPEHFLGDLAIPLILMTAGTLAALSLRSHRSQYLGSEPSAVNPRRAARASGP